MFNDLNRTSDKRKVRNFFQILPLSESNHFTFPWTQILFTSFLFKCNPRTDSILYTTLPPITICHKHVFMMLTVFQVAIIIASIMGKINLESIYTEYFIRQNRNCFHHSQQGKSALPLLYCLSLQNHIPLKSNSSPTPCLLLHFWMGLEEKIRTTLDSLTVSSWSLKPLDAAHQ